MLGMLLATIIVLSIVSTPAAEAGKIIDGAQYFADTLIKGMILGFKRTIPDKVPIPELNLKIEKRCVGTLKGKGGIVKGLKSLKSLPLQYSADADGMMYVSLPLHFSDLHIIYPKFSFKCWPFDKKGAADLLLKTNKVTITFQVTSMSTFVEKIASKECVFSVHSIKISEVGSVLSDITTDGLTGGFLTSFLFPYLASQTQKDVLNKMSLKVTNEISNILPVSSFWVCRDQHLEAIIEETGGYDEENTVVDLGSLQEHETLDK